MRIPQSLRSYRLLVSLPPCLFVFLAGFGSFFWYRATAPVPPAVELAGIDAAVVTAVQQARAAVSDAPRSAPAWGRLGMVLLTHDFAPEAKACFAQAEKLDPSEPRWPYHQGIALLEDDPETAILNLQRAVGLCGGTTIAPRACLADALLRQDRLDEAEVQLQRILQLHPDDSRALLALSRLAYRRGRLEESLRYAMRSLRDGVARKSSHLLLAEIYQRTGDGKAADQQSQKAALLREDPPWPDPFLHELVELRTGERANIKRAQKLLDLGRISQAVTLLRRMADDYPDSATSWLMLGRALVHEQNWVAAEQALNRALQLAPDNPEIHVQMGVALYCQWNPRATAHFRKAIELQPNCAPAYYNLGLWLLRIHDTVGAMDAFRQAIRIQPNLTDAYLGLGSQLALQGQVAEAVRHLQYAVQLNPADRRARQLLKHALEQVAVPTFP
jgi:tetratricopeptide (TPR) repeat protein